MQTEDMTIGNLLDKFEPNLTYHMNQKRRNITIPKANYTKYEEYEQKFNTLHIFTSKTDNIHVILDTRHKKIYLLHTDINSNITTYNFDGKKENEKVISNKSLKEIIDNYTIKDYQFNTLGELVDTLCPEIELSKKLKEHSLVKKDDKVENYHPEHNILFTGYTLEKINEKTFYKFQSEFDNDTILFAEEAPTYYIDSEKKKLYIETRGMVGTCILEFDENNQIIRDAHSWTVDMELFVKLEQ